jgi:hypothetical protein
MPRAPVSQGLDLMQLLQLRRIRSDYGTRRLNNCSAAERRIEITRGSFGFARAKDRTEAPLATMTEALVQIEGLPNIRRVPGGSGRQRAERLW